MWKFFDNEDLNGYTLVIPSIAVGNVGQLACDLLISSLNMKKTASVYSRALIPVLGYDPYDLQSGRLAGACELYRCPSRRLVVLQLRAPLVYKYAREFLQELVTMAKEKKNKEIIILTSSFAHEKKHIPTSQFRYVADELCTFKREIDAMKLIPHEQEGQREIKIYGGGFASLLFEISKENGVPCLILYKYCSEGDNIPDAYEMLSSLTCILPIFSKKSDIFSQLVQPVSWKLLFGRPLPVDIY